jgi:membrane associated rhomboid family serine protease
MDMSVSPWPVVGATAAVALLLLAAVPRFRRPAMLTYGLPFALTVGIVAAVATGVLDLWYGVGYVAIVAVAGAAIAVLSVGEGRAAFRTVRSRLLFGLPLGSLVVTAVVVGFYLLVQFGSRGLGSPLVLPFVSWSYFYPLGVLTAPFAHAGLGHVTGNVIATLALAPLAEYAFSHFPTGRGESAFGSWRTNPYVRALVLFPLGVVGVAFLTGIFSWGATIGFSGVVYAFAGFALVRYPLATVLAVTARESISVLWRVFNDPIVFQSAGPSYGPPWWAGIAIQGHLFGFLLGALLAAALVVKRDSRPSAVRIWLGTVLLTTSLSLWAVWWYGQAAEYVLFRALGLLLVVGLAVLFTLVVRLDSSQLVGDVSGRKLAFTLLLLPVVTMSLVAVPVNVATVQDTNLPGDPVEIEGYEVTYAENVQNQRVSTVKVPLFSQATNVSASGVIVANEERTIWTEQISAGELAFYGDRSVTVGGLGWEETVTVHRRGWVPVGGKAVYNVYVGRNDGSYRHVYASENSTARPVVAGRQVRVVARGGQFSLAVVDNDTVLSTVQLPGKNESVAAGGLTLARDGNSIVAIHDNTNVTVVTRETYE